MNDTPRPPIHLDRSELDRVIRRAVELQLREGTAQEMEPSLSEDEVLRIGREVGLEPSHVRRAMGELRAEALVPALPPDGGPMRQMIGPGRVRAERVVPGAAGDVEEHLVRWLSEVESLHAVRRRAGVSLWEPAEGFVAQLQRGLKWGGQRYELAQAKQVEVSVLGLEDGYALVTATVDLRNIRMEHGGGFAFGFAVAGTVFTTVSTLAVLPPVGVVGAALAGTAIVGGAGAAIGRATYQQKLERMRLAAEGLLDKLERGELVRPQKRRL